MGAIQSSINSALGTAAIAGGITKHIQVQEKQAKLAEEKTKAEIASTQEQLNATKLAYKNDTIEAAKAIGAHESTFGDLEFNGKKIKDITSEEYAGLDDAKIKELAGIVDNFREGKLKDDRIKKLEWKGFAFEGAEASFELLIIKTLGQLPDFFEISGFRVIGDTFLGEKNHNIITEASVKVKIHDHNIHTVAEGEGPVNALDTALRKALVEFYPEVLKYKLCDFKVRILDSKDGTAATVRVNVETTDGINKWDTVGVSEDIIEASYMAISDSMMYGLILHNPDCMDYLD